MDQSMASDVCVCMMSSAAPLTCTETQPRRNFSEECKGGEEASPSSSTTSGGNSYSSTNNRANASTTTRIVYHDENVNNKNKRENVSTKTSTATGMTLSIVLEQEEQEVEGRRGVPPPVHDESPGQDHADKNTAKHETTCITHPTGCGRAEEINADLLYSVPPTNKTGNVEEEEHEWAKSCTVPWSTDIEQKKSIMNRSRQHYFSTPEHRQGELRHHEYQEKIRDTGYSFTHRIDHTPPPPPPLATTNYYNSRKKNGSPVRKSSRNGSSSPLRPCSDDDKAPRVDSGTAATSQWKSTPRLLPLSTSTTFEPDKLCHVRNSTRTVEQQQRDCNPPVFEEKSQHMQHHISSPHWNPVTYPPTRQSDSFDTAAGHSEKKGTTRENHEGHSLPSSSQQQPPYMYYSSQRRRLDAPMSGNDSSMMMSYYGGHPSPSNYYTSCPTVPVPVQDYRPTTATAAISQQPPHCYSYTYPFTGSTSVPFVPHEQFAMYPYYSPNFAVQHSNQHTAPSKITTTLKQPSEYFHGGKMRPVSSTHVTGSSPSPAFTSSNLTGTIIDVNTSSAKTTTAAAAAAASLLDTPDSPMQKEDDPYKSGGSLDSPSASSNKKTPRKKRKKKPKDCPRRPLSAYNFFFKDERKKILDAIPHSKARKKSEDDKIRESITWPGKKRPPHGKIGFENLAKVIGERWKHVDSTRLKYYKDLATKDLQRYAEEMRLYEEKQVAKKNKNGGPCTNDEDEISNGMGNARTHEHEFKNKRKISTCSHEHHITKGEAPSKMETTKRRKPPTMKQQLTQNDSCEKIHQRVLEDGDISPQDIDQDDPFVNFDAASFVNSFSFDNEDLTSSGKVYHGGTNSSSLLKGMPFNESWIADLNQSESND